MTPELNSYLLMAAVLTTFVVGWVGFRKIVNSVPSWVVIVVYESPYYGDDIKLTQHLFYLRKKGEVRGGESLAQKFWTERGAKAAAAELKFSGHMDVDADTFMGKNSFRFVEIRIVRIKGL